MYWGIILGFLTLSSTKTIEWSLIGRCITPLTSTELLEETRIMSSRWLSGCCYPGWFCNELFQVHILFICLLTIQNHAKRLLIKALFVILRIDQPVQFHANNNPLTFLRILCWLNVNNLPRKKLIRSKTSVSIPWFAISVMPSCRMIEAFCY